MSGPQAPKLGHLPSDDRGVPTQSAKIDRFLAAVAKANVPARGRLIFALDATMSRQPLWDMAQGVQTEMFSSASAHGGLDLQLVYFRGFSECRASRFISPGEPISQGQGLRDLMAKISVRAGPTQIEKVLAHARAEQDRGSVRALIFIGDAMEEPPETLYLLAGELGLLGMKIFMFQEGHDRRTETVFRQIARLSGGAYAAFDLSAPSRLAALLAGAAAYAAGGREALQVLARDEARLLLSQIG